MAATEALTRSDIDGVVPDIPKQSRDPNTWADDEDVLEQVVGKGIALNIGHLAVFDTEAMQYASSYPANAIQPRY